jgi:hypothetical protein
MMQNDADVVNGVPELVADPPGPCPALPRWSGGDGRNGRPAVPIVAVLSTNSEPYASNVVEFEFARPVNVWTMPPKITQA